MSYHDKIKDIDLEQFNHEVEEYTQTWQAADQYAYCVLKGTIPTGKHARDACARYIYDRACRTDLEFRNGENGTHDAIGEVIDFANKLKHVKGKMAGKPVMLMMWMIFVLANLYGWYYIDGERAGERRFTKALTLVARGNAKSFLCSIVALYTMATSPNGAPACYSAARTAKQAGIVFKDAKLMLRSADWEISSLYRVSMYKIESLANDGIFEALASDAQSADGMRVALGICDELHAHHSSDLMNTLITGTSATVNPLIFSISTAGTQLDGICVNERNLVRDINQGIENVDDYFGIEYSIDDEDNWEDEEIWYKANPSLGHAVNLNSLRGELARAKQSAANKKDFLTKYCNRFVNIQDNPYIDTDELRVNCARDDLDITKYFNRECYLGLDLAQRFDLAALAFLFPEEDGSLTVFLRHYCARGALKKLTNAKHENYLKWEDEGHLIITNGNSTDFEYVKDDIRFAAKMFDLQMVGYDPYAATQLALELEGEGIEMVEVRQSFAQLSEPAKLLQTLIADGLLNYQSTDHCFEWNAANAVCTIDKNENIKVHKALDKPHDKVDSIIALITGLNPESLKEPKPKDPYKERGLLMI